ncbi:MAG: PIN domain-containing protein [Pleurocapsa sp.]
MTRLYLDTSIYNRPLDDQTQAKIFLETQAVVLILNLIDSQLVELVDSGVLEYENSRNPFPLKQKLMSRYLKLATIYQSVNEVIRQRAEQLEMQGIKAIDALHVATAEVSKSDYFITCDKRLINRCRELTIKVINPIDFILEIENEN